MNASNSLQERTVESSQSELIYRVLASHQFKSSPKLCEFFRYVIDCSLRNAPEEATEQQIGIHVFHREPGYNSSDDSVVRSQARLLRQKLAAYFADEGLHEDFTIEIPKGHYLPVFHPAKRSIEVLSSEPLNVQSEGNAELFHEAETSQAIATPQRPKWLWQLLATAVFSVALGLLLGIGWSRTSHSVQNRGLDLFWKPFLIGEPPLVIYSNPHFTGTPYTGLKLASPNAPISANDLTEIADDTYTGTGEASAIRELTRLFDAHHADFFLKRSRLVTWDEAKTRNLIFIGAASQNSALQDIQTNADFLIDLDQDHQGFILNRHPHPAEPPSFRPSSPNEEYAIVAFLPGIEPGTKIVIFTGLTTNGTQAAVEFMCNPDNVQRLTKAIGRSGSSLVPFESVLHIKMSGGVPIRTEIAAIHARS
jgi:hypothetical protein